MKTKQALGIRERDRSRQLRIVTAIFIVLFTLVCYLLARSMVSHNFSGGGRDNMQTQQQ